VGNGGRLVFSTREDALCPSCRRPREDCTCARPGAPAKRKGVVRVGRETQGRRGKGVTVVHGLALGPVELAALAKELKARCGSGGTVKAGVIEIQGEHRDRIVAELESRGYTVRRSGG
jgi:translation initiation factor 1